MWVFRLGKEIWKRREEEDRKLMDKDAEMEAKYQAKKVPKATRRGGKVPGGRSKTTGGGGAAGWRGTGGSIHGGGREKERGKLKHEKCP